MDDHAVPSPRRHSSFSSTLRLAPVSEKNWWWWGPQAMATQSKGTLARKNDPRIWIESRVQATAERQKVEQRRGDIVLIETVFDTSVIIFSIVRRRTVSSYVACY